MAIFFYLDVKDLFKIELKVISNILDSKINQVMNSFAVIVELLFVANLLLTGTSHCAELKLRQLNSPSIESVQRSSISTSTPVQRNNVAKIAGSLLVGENLAAGDENTINIVEVYTSLLNQNSNDSKLQQAIIALLKSKYTTISPNKDSFG